MIQNIKNCIRIVGFSGLLNALKSLVFGSLGVLELKRKDCAHPFQLRISSSDIQTCIQVFVYKEYDFFAEREIKTIIDAGANIGLASIYFANKYPSAKIIAIEPEHSNFLLLQRNVNPYPNIIPIQAALWHENDEINLIDPGLGKWGFMTEMKNSSKKVQGDLRHTVSAITVDKIIEDFNLETVDILKIDIEGAEKEVFSNSSVWIENVDSIIIELHERMKPGCNRSFYRGSNGFDNEWLQGENVYLSRNNCLRSCSN